MRYNLSVVIPARNEMFLAQTVADLLKNKRGNTEILVGLDSQWSDPPLVDHPDVTIFYSPTPLGMRAMTNQLVRLSKAKYIMKIDAHCAVDEGFDVKMMSEMKDHYTMVPVMKNLHVFDWVCKACGDRRYQGKKPVKCNNKSCSNTTDFYRDIVWRAKNSPNSTAFRFDKTLHFQYWNDYKKKQIGDVVDTMSIQGSCFMLTREKYWELNICDEKHGKWGQQGVEVACKTWLSGGEVKCNKNTWYAHLFRTQGGDFGFPYPISGREQDKAREYSQNLFLNGKWDQAKYDLNWLLNKFHPVPDWHDVKTEKKQHINTDISNKTTYQKKQIVFYTDNQLNLKIAHAVQKKLKKVGLPIISVSLKPMNFGKNINLSLQRGYLTMAKQILAGLEASDAEIVFLCEHDVLYHPSHFDFIPSKTDVYYYNTNVWRLRLSDGHSLYCDDLKQLSGLCAYRETLIKHFKERIRRIENLITNNIIGHIEEGKIHEVDDKKFNKGIREMGFEPGTHGRPERVDDLKAESWKSEFPNIDIRHDGNLTPSRWNKEQFRNERYTRGWTEKHVSELPGWDFSNGLLASK